MDENDDMYDVVSSKAVVPPEGSSILDVVTNTVCRVAFSGEFFRATIVQRGK